MSPPSRNLDTDLCVLGGGSGGIGAALAAARAGVRVVLVERNEILGGASTMAWVSNWEPSVGGGGLPQEIWQRMSALPLATAPLAYREGEPRHGGKSMPYEPLALALTAAQMLEETPSAPVVLLGATLTDADARDGELRAVRVSCRGEACAISAPVFVDATGDGTLCSLAGCEVMLGEDARRRFGEPSAPEEPKPHFNSLTLMYRLRDTGVAQPTPPRPDLPKPCPFPAARYPMPNGDLMINAVDMLDADVLEVLNTGRLRRHAEKLVLDHFHQLREREGFGTWALCGIAPEIGVRESRRIEGEYVLREQDCLAGLGGQSHEDMVAITDHSLDVHGAQGGLRDLPGAYGIPFRCLLPKGTRNLLVACRAASFSHLAAASCRLQRTMMTLGQAAGNAAALALAERVPLRSVPVAELQRRLREQGVEVPE
jgi:hypothetical protein